MSLCFPFRSPNAPGFAIPPESWTHKNSATSASKESSDKARWAPSIARKVLPAHFAQDPAFIARFKQEAQAAAALNHPHIVQIYAAGENDGTHFFAMEYVDGETLGKRVDRKGRLDPREALAVAIYVARALDSAWKRARIIHRDIKPDNIFLSREGEVKVGDLGLAKVLGAQATSATQTGMSMGSPFYVSPEQAVGNREIDFRADIYSLGCTLFHMLTGATPYEGDSAMGVMLQHLTQPPPEIQSVWPKCPPAIVGMLDRMLRKDAGARHQSYEELLEDLAWVSEKIEEQPEAPASPTSPAISMIVPTPRAIATAPVAAGKAITKPVTVVPEEKGKGLLYGVMPGVMALLAVIAFVWILWKKPASHTAETAIPSTPVLIAKEKVSESTTAEQPPAKPEPEKAVASVPTPEVPQTGADTASTAPTANAWIDLFTGRDVSQWRGSKQEDFPIATWVIENGALHDLPGPNAQTLVTRESYRDFELEFKWKLNSGGNSGIIYGTREFQLVDDVANQNGKVPVTSCGALCYFVAPNEKKRLKTAGEYNRGRLIVRGNQVEHWINGEKVVEYELGSPSLKSIVASGQSKNLLGYRQPSPEFTEVSDTPIGFQGSGGNVWFRNVRIRKLSASPIAPAASVTSNSPTSGAQAIVAGTLYKTAALARKVTAPFAGTLAGTIWTVRDSLGDESYFEFAQGGALNYETKRGFRPNGKWRQDGSTVSIEINDGVAKLTGTLSGRQMRGNASSTTGGHWTWEATPR